MFLRISLSSVIVSDKVALLLLKTFGLNTISSVKNFWHNTTNYCIVLYCSVSQTFLCRGPVTSNARSSAALCNWVAVDWGLGPYMKFLHIRRTLVLFSAG